MDWGGDGYSGSSAVLIEIVNSEKRYLKGLFIDLTSARQWLEKLGFINNSDLPEVADLQKSLPPTFVYKDDKAKTETWVRRQSPTEMNVQVAYVYQMNSTLSNEVTVPA